MLQGKALPQLGTDLDRDSSAPRPQGREDHHGPASGREPKDYFQERDGQRFAGTRTEALEEALAYAKEHAARIDPIVAREERLAGR